MPPENLRLAEWCEIGRCCRFPVINTVTSPGRRYVHGLGIMVVLGETYSNQPIRLTNVYVTTHSAIHRIHNTFNDTSTITKASITCLASIAATSSLLFRHSPSLSRAHWITKGRLHQQIFYWQTRCNFYIRDVRVLLSNHTDVWSKCWATQTKNAKYIHKFVYQKEHSK